MRAVRPWGLQLCHGASLLGDELLRVVYWLLLRLQGLLYWLRRLRRDALLYRSRRRGRYLRRVVVVGKVLGVRLKLRLSLWLGLELRHWSVVLVRAVAERLLVLLVRLSLLLVVVVLLLLRMEVVHGGGVGVCLMRLRLDLGVGILRHRLHLGVLGRCRKEVGACLILLVAHIRHRVPGSILLLLLLVRVLLMLLLMLVLLMELLLLKLRLMLLVLLRIARLRGHLLIAMAIIGLPMARRLLAPVVHGGICHSRALFRRPLSLQLISSTSLPMS